MASLIKSEAAFEEWVRECGLPGDELERLKTAGSGRSHSWHSRLVLRVLSRPRNSLVCFYGHRHLIQSEWGCSRSPTFDVRVPDTLSDPRQGLSGRR